MSVAVILLSPIQIRARLAAAKASPHAAPHPFRYRVESDNRFPGPLFNPQLRAHDGRSPTAQAYVPRCFGRSAGQHQANARAWLGSDVAAARRRYRSWPADKCWPAPSTAISSSVACTRARHCRSVKGMVADLRVAFEPIARRRPDRYTNARATPEERHTSDRATLAIWTNARVLLTVAVTAQ